MFRDLALMLIVFCLAAFPAEKIVRANDDNDLIEERQPVYDVDPINIEPRNVAADIDNWVYGVDRNGTRGAELSLSSQLQRRVNMLARSMSLSEGQIDQLSLAGQGDIRRFMDRVDEVKARFGHARADRTRGEPSCRNAAPCGTTFAAACLRSLRCFPK